MARVDDEINQANLWDYSIRPHELNEKMRELDRFLAHKSQEMIALIIIDFHTV